MHFIKKNIFLFYLTLFLLVLISCDESGLDSSIDDFILSTQDKKIVDASNNFGFDIFRITQQNKSNENIFFSPFEISASLNYLLNGASGTTYDYINYYINPANYTLDIINNSYKKIIEAINIYSPELLFANSFWYENGIGVNEHFKNIGDFFYGYHIDSVYFQDEDDIEKISEWIYTTSNNEFSYNYEDNESKTSMLIHTFSLNMQWRKKFDNTVKAKFKIADSDSITVDMLKVNGFYNYFSNDLFELIEIPYSDENLSLLAFHIKESSSIREVTLNLNSANWNYWINQLSKTAIDLTIPKLELQSELDINSYIENSSLSFIIDDNNGYTGISTSDFGIDNFYTLSSFNIRPDGVVPALNSDNIDNFNSASITPICFDSPFLFVIKENNSNLLLLSGIINNPK